MDYSAFLERLKPHWLPIGLALIGFAFLLYGLISFMTPKDKEGQITFEAASDTRSGSFANAQVEDSPRGADTVENKITIDVAGAVEKPGVYDLPADARVQDALIAAGGMNSDADREKVAKAMNLAAKLTDGGKIYIPFVGDPTNALIANESNGTTVVLGSATGLININTASTKDLDALQGVGQVTAEKIINGRPYGSIEELVSKKIVGQKVYSDIKDKISVY